MGIFTEDETDIVKAAKLWRPPPPRGNPYSVTMPGTKKEGRSPIYRHWRAQEKLCEALDPECLTIHDLFEKCGRYWSKDGCFWQ